MYAFKRAIKARIYYIYMVLVIIRRDPEAEEGRTIGSLGLQVHEHAQATMTTTGSQ